MYYGIPNTHLTFNQKVDKEVSEFIIAGRRAIEEAIPSLVMNRIDYGCTRLVKARTHIFTLQGEDLVDHGMLEPDGIPSYVMSMLRDDMNKYANRRHSYLVHKIRMELTAELLQKSFEYADICKAELSLQEMVKDLNGQTNDPMMPNTVYEEAKADALESAREFIYDYNGYCNRHDMYDDGLPQDL